MKEAVNTLIELEKAEKLSPRIIDVTIDKAMYKHILSLVKKSGNLAKRYYVKKIDYLNILSFLRVQKLSLPLEFFVTGFIEGGTLSKEVFENSFDSVEKFKENTKQTEFREQPTINNKVEVEELATAEVETDITKEPSHCYTKKVQTPVAKHDAALLAQETPAIETPATPTVEEVNDLAVVETAKPQEKMVTLTERDIPISRPENYQYTPEELALMKKQANEGFP